MANPIRGHGEGTGISLLGRKGNIPKDFLWASWLRHVAAGDGRMMTERETSETVGADCHG